MIFLEGTSGNMNLDGLFLMLALIMIGPTVLLFIIAIILAIKKKKKAALILVILGIVYFIIGLGICKSM